MKFETIAERWIIKKFNETRDMGWLIGHNVKIKDIYNEKDKELIIKWVLALARHLDKKK